MSTFSFGIVLFFSSLGTLTLFFSFSFLSSLFISLLFAYLPSFLDKTEFTAEGRIWKECIYWEGWRYITKGWKLKVEEGGGLEEGRQSIFAAFPHGVLSLGHLAMACDGLGWFSGGYHKHDRRDLGASVCYKTPFYRDLLLWLGMVDADVKVAKKVLNSGKSLYILPGGTMEQMMTLRDKHRVFLNTRKGFVRLAVEYGADLVPIYCFGETDLYDVSHFLFDFRLWICKKFQVALPLFYSKRFGFPIPLVPYRANLQICVGKPLRVDKVSPTDPNFVNYVDEKHKEFISELIALFDRHKEECGYADAVLEVLPVENKKDL